MKNFGKAILIICSFCFFFSCDSYPYSKKEATDIAINYISEKYNQEMKYLFTYFSPWWIHGKIYRVYFSPVNDGDLRFYVDVGGGRGSPIRGDNYHLVRFRKYSEKYFLNRMNNIWNNVDIYVKINTEYYYMVNSPMEINEEMNPEEIRHYIGLYFITVETNRTINELNAEEEAKNIMEAIEIIKDKKYAPNGIFFEYDNEFIKFWHEPSMDTSQRKLRESCYYWNMVENYEKVLIRLLKK